MTDEDIVRLEIAVDDTFFMRGRQTARNLQTIVERLADRQCPTAQTVAQGLAFKQFGDGVGRAITNADVEDCQNVGMVQRRGSEGFLLEAVQPLRLGGDSLRQNLDRYLPFEARVAGAIDLAHSARAQKANHFIRPKLGSRGQRHEWGQLYTATLETGLCPNIASLGASRQFAGRARADVFCDVEVRNRAKRFP